MGLLRADEQSKWEDWRCTTDASFPAFSRHIDRGGFHADTDDWEAIELERYAASLDALMHRVKFGRQRWMNYEDRSEVVVAG